MPKTTKTTKTTKTKTRKINPSYHNIEKSAFHRGEYVGYGGGDVFRIRKTQVGWTGYATKTKQLVTGETLREVSFELTKLKAMLPNPVPRLPGTRGVREYTTQSGWLRAVSRINPKAQIKSHAGTLTAIGIGVWSGDKGVILPSIERIALGGRGHGGKITRKRVVKSGAQRHGPIRTKVAAKRRKNPARKLRLVWKVLEGSRLANVYRDSEFGEYVVRLVTSGKHQKAADYFTDDLADAKGTAEAMVRKKNPANSPALSMSKKAYVNRPSQSGRKAPTARLKKRRNYAYLMAQRGFKGAYPNPSPPESKFDIWDWYQTLNGTLQTHKKSVAFIDLPGDKFTLAEVLKAMKDHHLLDWKANTKNVKASMQKKGVIVLRAVEDDYVLGILRARNP